MDGCECASPLPSCQCRHDTWNAEYYVDGVVYCANKTYTGCPTENCDNDEAGIWCTPETTPCMEATFYEDDESFFFYCAAA